MMISVTIITITTIFDLDKYWIQWAEAEGYNHEVIVNTQ